jgi:hypothetical protein
MCRAPVRPKRSYQAKNKVSGRTYAVTVQAVTAFGVSDISEVLTVTTVSLEEVEAEEREQKEQRRRRAEEKKKKKKTVEQRKEEKVKIVEQRKEVKKEIRLIQRIQGYWQLVILMLLLLGIWLYLNRKQPKRRRWHGVDN